MEKRVRIRTVVWGAFFLLVGGFGLIQPSFALNKMNNASFAADASSWTQNNLVIRAQALEEFTYKAGTGNPTNSYMAEHSPGGGGGDANYSDALLQQTFTTASEANVVITFDHLDINTGSPGTTDFIFNFIGEIRKSDGTTLGGSANGPLFDTFFMENTDIFGNLHTGAWVNTTWTSPTPLASNSTYIVRLYWDLYGQSNKGSGSYADNIRAQVSPSGLVASETVNGASLTWNVSTPGYPALKTYRVYVASDPLGPFTQKIASWSNVATWTSMSNDDVLCYGVADIDNINWESPMSPFAYVKRAKLDITNIIAPTTVSQGQNDVEVKMVFQNSGLSPLKFSNASLTFSLGSYSWRLISPSTATTVLTGGEIATATFRVNVAVDSPTGDAIIDANATGTAGVLDGRSASDSSSAIRPTWTIQKPANLVFEAVTASETVYRGQNNIPILLRVTNNNDNNGAWAYFNSAAVSFTLGTYVNLHAETTLPTIVYGGSSKIIRYLVDVHSSSATGTSIIDAQVTWADYNDPFNAILASGALLPATWLIQRGNIATYKDPSFVISADSFNIGAYTVYAKATDLEPNKNLKVRWYGPPNFTLATSSSAVNSGGAGEITHEFDLSPSTATGTWKAVVTKTTDEIVITEHYFNVVDPATMAVQLVLPAFVTEDQFFIASMAVGNPGGAKLTGVYPGLLASAGTGVAASSSNPTPTQMDIYGNSTDTFIWTWRATTSGTLTLNGTAYGYDDNSGLFMWAASKTSNVCTIQRPAVPAVASVTTDEINVYPGQHGLKVDMGIKNTGSASVSVSSASLLFVRGTYSQSLSSPTALPFSLPGNSAATFSFYVDVASSSAVSPPVASIGGTFWCTDVNNIASAFYPVGGSDSWTIKSIKSRISGISTFNPEQYTFNRGQTVHIEFSNLPTGDDYQIRIYDVITGGAPLETSPVLPGLTGTVTFSRALATNAPTRKWRWEISKSTGGWATIGVAYFDVQAPGSLTVSLILTPSTLFEGENFNAYLSVSNLVASGSTISPATASALMKTAGSTGDATFVSSSPSSLSVIWGFPATFTWVYTGSSMTGIIGSYSMIATLSSSAYGIDVNSEIATSSRRAVSNSIRIYKRALTIPSITLDLGILECGASSTLYFNATSTGNYDLNNVSWKLSNLYASGGAFISRDNAVFSPSSFYLASISYRLASLSFFLPYNQPAGTYTATMTVYDDLNLSGDRDPGEAFADFGVRVVASSSRRVLVTTKMIDIGDYVPSVQVITASQAILAENIGNLSLASLTFTRLSGPVIMYASGPRSCATDASYIGSCSAVIPAGYASGVYYNDFRLFEDSDGDGAPDATEASDTFTCRVGIGGKTFFLTPDPLIMGFGTPTMSIDDIKITCSNTGELNLTKLKGNTVPLVYGASSIPATEITIVCPALVGTDTVGTPSIYVFVPAGTASGTYSGVQSIYEDNNLNGVWDAGEASDTFNLQLTVNEYRAVQVALGTVDMGGVPEGASNTVSFNVQNVGNLPLDDLNWLKVNLLYGANPPITTAWYEFFPPPPGPLNAAGGAIFSVSGSITVPIGTLDGQYIGANAFIYDDRDANLVKGAAEPQDNFNVTVFVGSKTLDIIQASLSINNAAPGTLSTSVNFTLKNTGGLILVRPTATATALWNGAKVIATGACIFTPNPLPNLNYNQTTIGAWSVNVPAQASDGVALTGTMTIWDDDNIDGIMDSDEASTTCALSLTVSAMKAIDVSNSLVDLGWVPAGQTTTGSFEILNVGNRALDDVRGWGVDLTKAGGTIASNNVLFTLPASPFPMPLSLASQLATVTLTVPAGTAEGTYIGNQIIYNDFNTADDKYNVGTNEEFDTFTLKVSVGTKGMDTPILVDLGTANPQQSPNANFITSNIKTIPLSRVKWQKVDFTHENQLATMASTVLTLTPAGPFGIAGMANANCNAKVDIPIYQTPGTYLGSHTVYEDDNSNGILDGFEASDTFQVKVLVATYPRLTIPFSIACGNIVRGKSSATETVQIQNVGNATLTNLIWTKMNLSGPSAGVIPAASLTFTAVAPAVVAPGAFTYASMSVGPIANDQVTGPYSTSSPYQKLSSTDFPDASDTFDLSCLVVPSGPQVGTGTAYQEIATATLVSPARYILSGFVCPSSGSAAIGFLLAKEDGSIALLRSVEVDSAGSIKSYGSPVSAGSLKKAPADHPTLGSYAWYRLYCAFDYAFDPNIASNAYLVLYNTSPTNASYSVWFDGIQLEKAVFPNQLHPTSFHPRVKLVSPLNSQDLRGDDFFYEW